MSRYEYQQYIGKSKEERREVASATGWAERKRFLLSSNPEIKKRLAGLKEIVRDLQNRYPEFISLSLYGSLVKGYATPKSDIDAALFIDEDVEREAGRGQPYPYETPTLVVELERRLRKELSLTTAQFIVNDRKISKKMLLENTRLGWVGSIIIELFYLSIGRKIYEYRKIVLDELETMGAKGDEILKDLCDQLCEWEWGTYDPQTVEKRRKLYPKTVAEAKKYFLRGDV